MILSVLCLASFSGAIAPLSGQLNLADQEELYKKTKLQESYAVCIGELDYLCPLVLRDFVKRLTLRYRTLLHWPAWPPVHSSLHQSPTF
jgi:hypothetical protein